MYDGPNVKEQMKDFLWGRKYKPFSFHKFLGRENINLFILGRENKTIFPDDSRGRVSKTLKNVVYLLFHTWYTIHMGFIVI